MCSRFGCITIQPLLAVTLTFFMEQLSRRRANPPPPLDPPPFRSNASL